MKRNNFFMTLLVVLGKWTKLAKVVKLFKLLKFGKILITFFTMVLSALVYAFWLGPWFSIGFVLMLFIHEMGHVAAMKIKGMQTSAPVFIPLLGAVIFSPPFKNKEDEAFVGYAGPLVGGAAALVTFGVWALLPHPSDILLLISYTAAFLNLFNLIPIRPLDGGRSTQIIGEWFKYFGFVVLFLFSLYIRQPVVLLIWILVLSDTNFKPQLKLGIGLVCQIAMMILMSAGLGGQAWWVNMIDVAIASFINFLFFCETKYISWDDEACKGRMVDEPVAMRVRMKWFFLYFALVGGLIALMVFQGPYLPHPVKNQTTISVS